MSSRRIKGTCRVSRVRFRFSTFQGFLLQNARVITTVQHVLTPLLLFPYSRVPSVGLNAAVSAD